jgi:hypothetical protein
VTHMRGLVAMAMLALVLVGAFNVELIRKRPL